MSKYIKTQIALTTAMIINERLSKGIVTIEFYKVSKGKATTDTDQEPELRVMRATTDPKLLPASTEEHDTVAIDMSLCKVYDVEAQGWRSFRLDRLKTIDSIDAQGFVIECFKQGMQ